MENKKTNTWWRSGWGVAPFIVLTVASLVVMLILIVQNRNDKLGVKTNDGETERPTLQKTEGYPEAGNSEAVISGDDIEIAPLVICGTETNYKVVSNYVKFIIKRNYDTTTNVLTEEMCRYDGKVFRTREIKCDDTGNVLCITCYDVDKRIISETKWQYDENGNKLCETHCGLGGKIEFEIKWEYDSKGKKLSQTHYSAGEVQEETKWEYDKNGNKQSETICGLAVNGKVLYEYDKLGNQVRVVRYDTDGEIVESENREYDKSGNLVRSICYSADGKVMKKTEWQYNESGKLLYINEYDAAENLTYKAEWQYNESGNPICKIDYSGTSKGTVKTEWKYEEDKVRQVNYNTKGSVEYLYDGAGNKICQTYYTHNGNYRTKTEWEYDGNGNVTCEKQYRQYRSEELINMTEYTDYQTVPFPVKSTEFLRDLSWRW